MSHGTYHKEGGWPRFVVYNLFDDILDFQDTDPQDLNQVMRYRRKIEKDDRYVKTALELANVGWIMKCKAGTDPKL